MHVFLLHGKVHAVRRASGLCPVMFCFVGSCGFVGFVGAREEGSEEPSAGLNNGASSRAALSFDMDCCSRQRRRSLQFRLVTNIKNHS